LLFQSLPQTSGGYAAEPEAEPFGRGQTCRTKISKTAEHGTRTPSSAESARRLSRCICGKALLFRSRPQTSRGYAADPETEPHHLLADRTVTQSFTANRTAKPFQWVQICPTKISKTAEQTSNHRHSDPLQKPARQQGRTTPKHL